MGPELNQLPVAQPYSFPMQEFLEILKYTIPGLVVFATAYYMLQLYLDNQQRLQAMSQRSESLKITLPLRLQAYERLMLLCDRTEIQNLLLRIQTPGMTVRELRGSLLLAISQEFGHNTSQKLYVSTTLWKIIRLAKDETMAFVNGIAPELDPQADGKLLAEILFNALDGDTYDSPLQKAMVAIRMEAGELF